MLNVSASPQTITDALGRSRGFSLVEVMVVITILALLLLAGGGTFSTWIANGKVRSVAEDLANGLRIAQSESMRRNRVVALAITTATPALDVKSSTSGVNWYVESFARTSDATTTGTYIQGGNYGTQSGVAIASSSALSRPLSMPARSSMSGSSFAMASGCGVG